MTLDIDIVSDLYEFALQMDFFQILSRPLYIMGFFKCQTVFTRQSKRLISSMYIAVEEPPKKGSFKTGSS